MKTIMILGAGDLQIPAIIKSKKMGYKVIVIDKNKNAPGLEYADVSFIVSVTEKEKILKIAKKYKIDGIITLAMDKSLETLAYVSKILNLKGINKNTVNITCDKFLTRETLKKNGIKNPKYFFIDNFDKLCKIIENNNISRYVLKPTDNSGSRGVILIDKNTDLAHAYNYSKNFASKNLILEEFLEGKEISVESFSINGVHNIIQLTEKITTNAPYFVEIMHIQPASIDSKLLKKIEILIKNSLDSIELFDGPSHIEIMICNGEPIIVEIGARLGGDCISSDLIFLSTGIDLISNYIKFSLDQNLILKKKKRMYSVIGYIQSKPGYLKRIENIEDVRKMKGVSKIKILKNENEYIPELRNSLDRIGYVISFSENRDEAINICKEAIKKIKIEVIKK